ncbi:hypothetical protein [Bacillus rhizoplanae]|uniref:hypothetical protein n=1 Tax=Bacillus rhizoplanae TaxID=2880966 RepID=UPI003D19E19C
MRDKKRYDMKKILEIIGTVLLAFVDGKKVATKINEVTETETHRLQSKNNITNPTFTLCPSHM